MNLKPIVLGIQAVTLLLIFSFMEKYGITKFNLIGAGIIAVSLGINAYMFCADLRLQRWEKAHEAKEEDSPLRKIQYLEKDAVLRKEDPDGTENEPADCKNKPVDCIKEFETEDKEKENGGTDEMDGQ